MLQRGKLRFQEVGEVSRVHTCTVGSCRGKAAEWGLLLRDTDDTVLDPAMRRGVLHVMPVQRIDLIQSATHERVSN